MNFSRNPALNEVIMSSSPRRFVLQEISTTPLGLRSVDSDSNLVPIPDSFLTPSPEEQIIRQRSVRLCKVQPTSLQFEDFTCENRDTPSKTNLAALQQRRKRLLLVTPKNKSLSLKEHKRGVTKVKRPRLHKHSSSPLRVKLQGYTTHQLVTVIDQLVTDHPELEEEVRDSLPSPDLKPLEKRLNDLQRSVYRAFPTERWGSSRDAFCFRRVKGHLYNFKKACIEQGKVLLNAHCWEAVINYVITVWRYVHQLPRWDDPSHNDSKMACFRVLSAQCLQALKKTNLGREQCLDLHRRLSSAAMLNKEIQPCLRLVESLLEKF